MRTVLAAACLGILVISPVRSKEPVDWRSTRIDHTDQFKSVGRSPYALQQRNDFVLRELDLRPGDVVVDIGAGAGWWAERMAPLVGADGVIHAAEVDRGLN